MTKKLAVFDIDGTLFRWQLFHELIFELKDNGHFSNVVALRLEDKLAKWQAREGTFHDYETEVVKAIEGGIQTITVADFETAAQKVVDRSGHKVYAYTRSLLKDLKSKGYFLLAISGSQQEIAEIFAKKYGFDECIGALYRRTAEGGFEGSYERAVINKKGQLLKEFAAKNNFSLKDSYAIGDSNGDIEILKIVENPIAFNPNESLLKAAQQNGWPIVIERKNVSYKLKRGPSGYFLANTKLY